MHRRHLILGACALAFVPASASAADVKPFDAQAFAAAQEAGQSIVVEVHAPWWPVCKKQKPIVDRLSTDPAFAKVAVFRVDFDSSKDVLRQLNVHHQATVIGFKGKTEKARSVNDGRLEEIRKVFEASL